MPPKEIDNLVNSNQSLEIAELSVEYSLYHNYPNPFNTTSTIQFDVKDVSIVSLKIYDKLGREIATLINEQKASGSYEVNFDATKLTSGIYFYKVRTNNFVQTKKMLLIK